MVASTILFLLPVSTGIYDFRTDQRNDIFTVTTPVATTNATVQLAKPIYDNDTSTLVLTSGSSILDVPLYSSYNTTTRALLVIGLSDNLTRSLTVAYDVSADGLTGAMGTLLDFIPFIWMLMVIAFPVSALVAIWTGRAD